MHHPDEDPTPLRVHARANGNGVVARAWRPFHGAAIEAMIESLAESLPDVFCDYIDCHDRFDDWHITGAFLRHLPLAEGVGFALAADDGLEVWKPLALDIQSAFAKRVGTRFVNPDWSLPQMRRPSRPAGRVRLADPMRALELWRQLRRARLDARLADGPLGAELRKRASYRAAELRGELRRAGALPPDACERSISGKLAAAADAARLEDAETARMFNAPDCGAEAQAD